ncbi:hypothetical protein [Winogradskyella sp.]|uniref:hypothetical protein n=1 Tax=Winogradskyella sp. TaxID=1883156 RepID=UPI0025D12B01|nr:hypothetical protein [Winogradskyella sp.]
MIDFTKEDIEPLDWMVNEVIIRYALTPDDLVEAGIIKVPDGLEIDVTYNTVTEFKRYLYVLNKYNVCDCISSMDMINVRVNEYTPQFKTLGGFKKLYADLKKQEKREKLELRKTKVDLNLAEKMLEEYPKTKWFARIGFFIGIGLAILELIKLLIPILFPSDKT